MTLTVAFLPFAPRLDAAVMEFHGGSVSVDAEDVTTPNPSTITVSGLSDPPQSVRVKLNGLSYPFPENLDVFLLAPNGKVVALMSDAGGTILGAAVDLAFDDTASAQIQSSFELGEELLSGTYRPTDYQTGEPLPPGGTGSIGTSLSALLSGDVNGDWKLFTSIDQTGALPATILTSWTLELEVPPGFVVTDDLESGRYQHTSTLLQDGRVLVAGGYGAGRTTEIYDPATGEWSPSMDLSSSRGEHTATVLRDGTVLVAGGFDGSSNLRTAEIYDPISGGWSPTGSLTGLRRSHTATRLADGRVLVAGGYNV